MDDVRRPAPADTDGTATGSGKVVVCIQAKGQVDRKWRRYRLQARGLSPRMCPHIEKVLAHLLVIGLSNITWRVQSYGGRHGRLRNRALEPQ